MQEIEYVSYIDDTVFFFCSYRTQIKVRLNSTHYLKKSCNKLLLIVQQTFYEDLQEMYKQTIFFFFLNIYTTLYSKDLLRFRKNLLLSYKNDIN